ncbi:hypothetical protein ECZU51_18260 [Escherichia coli]|nr:hypothetical protein ECZU51_18260 [Escherichia coli]
MRWAENNPEWKTVAFNTNGEMVAPNGSIGFRWGEKGKWNLEQRDGKTGEETELQLSLLGSRMRSLRWASRTLVATARNTSTKWNWKTCCCTSCR